MIQQIKLCPICNNELEYEYSSSLKANGDIAAIFKQYCKNCNWEEKDESTTFKDWSIPPISEITIPNPFNIPHACRGCMNHPSNGGSGICNCTLGTQTIY